MFRRSLRHKTSSGSIQGRAGSGTSRIQPAERDGEPASPPQRHRNVMGKSKHGSGPTVLTGASFSDSQRNLTGETDAFPGRKHEVNRALCVRRTGQCGLLDGRSGTTRGCAPGSCAGVRAGGLKACTFPQFAALKNVKKRPSQTSLFCKGESMPLESSSPTPMCWAPASALPGVQGSSRPGRAAAAITPRSKES